jgi:hypothetical protein
MRLLGAIVIYTAPHSPDRNPIELMFGKYKQMLKRFHQDDWLTGHMKALMSISPEDASAYFKHCHGPHCDHFQGLENDDT